MSRGRNQGRLFRALAKGNVRAKYLQSEFPELTVVCTATSYREWPGPYFFCPINLKLYFHEDKIDAMTPTNRYRVEPRSYYYPRGNPGARVRSPTLQDILAQSDRKWGPFYIRLPAGGAADLRPGMLLPLMHSVRDRDKGFCYKPFTVRDANGRRLSKHWGLAAEVTFEPRRHENPAHVMTGPYYLGPRVEKNAGMLLTPVPGEVQLRECLFYAYTYTYRGRPLRDWNRPARRRGGRVVGRTAVGRGDGGYGGYSRRRRR